MKRNGWVIALQTLAQIIAAVLTALGATSCMSAVGMI